MVPLASPPTAPAIPIAAPATDTFYDWEIAADMFKKASDEQLELDLQDGKLEAWFPSSSDVKERKKWVQLMPLPRILTLCKGPKTFDITQKIVSLIVVEEILNDPTLCDSLLPIFRTLQSTQLPYFFLICDDAMGAILLDCKKNPKSLLGQQLFKLPFIEVIATFSPDQRMTVKTIMSFMHRQYATELRGIKAKLKPLKV